MDAANPTMVTTKVPDFPASHILTDPLTLVSFTTVLTLLAVPTSSTWSSFPSKFLVSNVSPSRAPSLSGVVTSKDVAFTPLYVGGAVGSVRVALSAILACIMCDCSPSSEYFGNMDRGDETGSSFIMPSVIGIDSFSMANSSIIAGMSLSWTSTILSNSHMRSCSPPLTTPVTIFLDGFCVTIKQYERRDNK